eukprot:1147432-Pelagomonas_calceolata.AAC.2
MEQAEAKTAVANTMLGGKCSKTRRPGRKVRVEAKVCPMRFIDQQHSARFMADPGKLCAHATKGTFVVEGVGKVDQFGAHRWCIQGKPQGKYREAVRSCNRCRVGQFHAYAPLVSCSPAKCANA